MSQSGSTNLPPQIQRGSQAAPLAQDAVKAKVLNVTGELRDVKTATRLEGQIIEKSSDGKARIRTDRGEIQLELRQKRLEALQRGDRVDIELPRGKPPQSAEVRPQQNTPLTTPNTETPSDTVDLRGSESTPLSSSATDTAAKLANIPSDVPQQRPLETDTAIRLTPLSSSQQVLPQSQIAMGQQSEPQKLIQLEQTLNPLTTILPAIQIKTDNIAQEALLTLPLNDILKGTETAKASSPQQTIINLATSALIMSQNLKISALHNTTDTTQSHIALTAKAGKQGTTHLAPIVNRLSSQALPLQDRIGAERSQMSQITDRHLDTMNHRFASRPLDGIIKHINHSGIIFKSIAEKQSPAHDGLIKTPVSSSSKSSTLNELSAKDIRLTEHSAGSLQARVSGFTDKNQPILSLVFPGERIERQFVMQFQTNNIETNSRITITPTSTAASANTAASGGTGIQTSMPVFSALQFMNTPEWQTLDESLKTLMLSQSASQALSNMTNTLPSPARPTQLAPTMMFFLAAVQIGDVKSWFGERVLDTLRSLGKGDLTNRLSSELSGIQRMSLDSSGQEWRTLPLPMMWQNEVHKIAMHYKDSDEDADKGDKDKKGTRFVFDLSLPRMGNVQLDGYTKAQQVDLILRTEKPLSSAMKQNMRQKYAAGLDASGMSGELGFRSKILEFSATTTPDNTAFSI